MPLLEKPDPNWTIKANELERGMYVFLKDWGDDYELWEVEQLLSSNVWVDKATVEWKFSRKGVMLPPNVTMIPSPGKGTFESSLEYEFFSKRLNYYITFDANTDILLAENTKTIVETKVTVLTYEPTSDL